MATETQEPDPIAELITNYYELNGSVVEELDQEPSPLEFMRFVARNAPFVVRGAAADWDAVRTWDARFLALHLRDAVVNVAVTPAGNADAPVEYQDGELVFAKPWEEDQPFPEFLAYVVQQEKDASFPPDAEVRYAQTQNDNLRTEYAALQQTNGVRRDIPFARIALQQQHQDGGGSGPEAVNLWLGNSRSATALHRDSYENVYVQIRGRKHFVLLPPACQPCVNERMLRPARFARSAGTGAGRQGAASSSSSSSSSSSGESSLRLVLDEEADGGQGQGRGGEQLVPFATWDPDRPAERATRYSALARPMRVTLDPGDMLYLPALWYHKVSQSCSEDGIVVAVNYWHDMDYTAPLYPMSTFVSSVYRSVDNAI